MNEDNDYYCYYCFSREWNFYAKVRQHVTFTISDEAREEDPLPRTAMTKCTFPAAMFCLLFGLLAWPKVGKITLIPIFFLQFLSFYWMTHSQRLYFEWCSIPTPPNFRVCAQLNALEKRFKSWHILYSTYMKIQSCVFHFSFRATLFFP